MAEENSYEEGYAGWFDFYMIGKYAGWISVLLKFVYLVMNWGHYSF